MIRRIARRTRMRTVPPSMHVADPASRTCAVSLVFLRRCSQSSSGRGAQIATDAIGFHAQRVLWMCSCKHPGYCVSESEHRNRSATIGAPESECWKRQGTRRPSGCRVPCYRVNTDRACAGPMAGADTLLLGVGSTLCPSPVICPACRVGNPPTNGDGVFVDVHRRVSHVTHVKRGALEVRDSMQAEISIE